MAKQLSIVEDDPFGPRIDVKIKSAGIEVIMSPQQKRAASKRNEMSAAEYQQMYAKPARKKKERKYPFPDKMKPLPGLSVTKNTPPSKSNSYKIITIKAKDFKETGEMWSSLGKTEEMKLWEKSFAAQCENYRQLGMKDKFTIDIHVYFKNNASDLDGCLKGLLDSLQDISAIYNDNLCYKIILEKHIDKINPRIEFILDFYHK